MDEVIVRTACVCAFVLIWPAFVVVVIANIGGFSPVVPEDPAELPYELVNKDWSDGAFGIRAVVTVNESTYPRGMPDAIFLTVAIRGDARDKWSIHTIEVWDDSESKGGEPAEYRPPRDKPEDVNYRAVSLNEFRSDHTFTIQINLKPGKNK